MKITKLSDFPAPLRESNIFTGMAWGQVVNEPPDQESGTRVTHVMFAPGGRSWWHSHAAGQLLIVTTGKGVIYHDGIGGAIIGPGDVIEVPANEWHWHGAAPDTFMSHLAINTGNWDSTVWRNLEVTGQEYLAQFA